MDKQAYMNALKINLRRLPKEDFDKAIDYFEEYFADAGVEQEAKAIQDLGSPEEAADQIIRSIAINNAKEPIKTAKKGFSAIWVGILAIFAAPIALPLAIMLALALFLVVFSIFLTLFCLCLAGGLLILMGPVSLLAGISTIPYSIPTFISCLGQGFCMTGLGLFLSFGMVKCIRSFFTAMTQLIVRLIKKDRKAAPQN